MKTLFYSTRPYDRQSMETVNAGRHELHFIDTHLDARTVALAKGFDAVCGFVNDTFDDAILGTLAGMGIRLVLLRCTGFNNVDLIAAEKHGVTVMRVTRYSPYAVAEFALTLMLALNRKIYRTYNKVREENFLLDGLLGFDMHGKTIGIVGTGKIGQVMAQILTGFGCRLLAYDPYENAECRKLGVSYLPFEAVMKESDIISLHIPLTPETHYIINEKSIALMKKGAMLINTSRGGLVDTEALVEALKAHRLGAVGLDVYEEEGDIFFRDLSGQVLEDDTFARLLSFPNVIVSGHQAFFTVEALHDIAEATIQNMTDFAAGRSNINLLKASEVVR